MVIVIQISNNSGLYQEPRAVHPEMRQARMGNCCNFSACGRMNIQNVTAPTRTHRTLTM